MQKIRNTKSLKAVRERERERERESYTLINKSAVLFSIIKNVNLSNIKETRLNLLINIGF